MNDDQPVGLEALETFADGLDHAEGIAIPPGGPIYVGGEAGQIYCVGEDDKPVEVASTGGFNLGLAIDGEGRLYVCDSAVPTVWRVDLERGERERFTSGVDGRPIAVPNWGCFDGEGNYYVTDSGRWGEAEGLVWVVRPGGRTEVFSEEPRFFPNGCAMAPDGSRLYVLESNPSAIVELPIGTGGGAGARVVLQPLGLIVPDGVAVTTDGSLVVSCYRPDSIYRWHPDDGLSLLAHDPQGTTLAAPTNVAFTGEDLGLLVVPNLGRWHLTRGRLGLNGTPLFRPTADVLGG